MRQSRWILLGLALVIAGVGYLGRSTWSLYSDQAAVKERNERRMRAAEAERAKLLDEKARLESSVGQEELARKQGYRKPNERPLDLSP
jgi:flagellar basal body-associated protein FliL